jgi:hypothetical protein
METTVCAKDHKTQLLTERIILDVKVVATCFDFINSTKTCSFQTYDQKK